MTNDRQPDEQLTPEKVRDPGLEAAYAEDRAALQRRVLEQHRLHAAQAAGSGRAEEVNSPGR